MVTRQERRFGIMAQWLTDFRLGDEDVDKLIDNVCNAIVADQLPVLNDGEREILREAARAFYGDDEDVESLFPLFGIA